MHMHTFYMLFQGIPRPSPKPIEPCLKTPYLGSSLVAQQVKDPALSLLWHGFDPWPRATSAAKKTPQNPHLEEKKNRYIIRLLQYSALYSPVPGVTLLRLSEGTSQKMLFDLGMQSCVEAHIVWERETLAAFAHTVLRAVSPPS